MVYFKSFESVCCQNPSLALTLLFFFNAVPAETAEQFPHWYECGEIFAGAFREVRVAIHSSIEQTWINTHLSTKRFDYLNLCIHALYVHMYIYTYLYIWRSYFWLSQHRLDIYIYIHIHIFWWLSLLHKTSTPHDMMPKTHHLPVGKFGDRNASSSGKNKKRSSQRENDMGIIANHRGCTKMRFANGIVYTCSHQSEWRL